MAFTADNRVRVTNDSSQWRGKLGTVLSAADGQNNVRLDGFQATQTVLIPDADLALTNFTSPVDYSAE